MGKFFFVSFQILGDGTGAGNAALKASVGVINRRELEINQLRPFFFSNVQLGQRPY